MSDHLEKNDASGPPILQSRAARVFLVVLALTVRNTHERAEALGLLRLLDEKVDLFSKREVADYWELSAADVVDLNHLYRILRQHMNNPDLQLADPPEGAA